MGQTQFDVLTHLPGVGVGNGCLELLSASVPPIAFPAEIPEFSRRSDWALEALLARRSRSSTTSQLHADGTVQLSQQAQRALNRGGMTTRLRETVEPGRVTLTPAE